MVETNMVVRGKMQRAESESGAWIKTKHGLGARGKGAVGTVLREGTKPQNLFLKVVQHPA